MGPPLGADEKVVIVGGGIGERVWFVAAVRCFAPVRR